MYQFCEDQDIEIDTLIHEDGAGADGDQPAARQSRCDLADQAFLFKRTAREAALRHKMYATFMAKPHAKEPGSAMHIHQSIVDTEDAQEHLQRTPDGTPSPLFFSHIAGLQKYLPAAMALFAPNVNSYRRITPLLFGADQRAVGLRQPHRGPARADVECRRRAAWRTASPARTPIRTSPSPHRSPAAISAWSRGCSPPSRSPAAPTICRSSLPRSLEESLRLLRECEPLIDILGERFVSAFTIVKEAEYEVFLQVISSWEREHLLLNV